jgi:diguanylate cyclase (GGDEF)-like protein
MTAQQAILTLGTVTLAGCGTGLVLIHDSNPLLKGLNWMGTALLVGGLGAGFTLGAGSYAALEPLANLCILLAFLCCYRADHYLVGSGVRQPLVSTLALIAEIIAAVLQWSHILGSREATVVLSIAIALQLETTSRLIDRSTIAKGRLAAQFTVTLMRLLALANLARGGCAAAGFLAEARFADAFNLFTYNIFVASAIGLAFAFFWRTTTKLSMELEHMASTDPLTRVYNRRVFLNWCESEQSRSLRLNLPFSVLMLDFDHFKRINDTYGHHVGDQVLCAAVERIQDSIRGIDVLCRWGGEEFAVLLPNASAEATQLVAERVRRNVPSFKAVSARFTSPEFDGLHVTASIGTATYYGATDDFQSMLQRADAAMYEAKRSGRDRVVLAAAPTAIVAERQGSQLVLEPR